MAMLGPNFDCGYPANKGYSSTVSEFDGYAGGLYIWQMCRNIVTCRNLVIDSGNIKAFLMVILSGIDPAWECRGCRQRGSLFACYLSALVTNLIPVIKTIHLTRRRLVEDNSRCAAWWGLSLGGMIEALVQADISSPPLLGKCST